MYSTRPCAPFYRIHPTTLSGPPEGVHSSGYLLLADEEAADNTCCFGAFLSSTKLLHPFPQNKKLLNLDYVTGSGVNQMFKYSSVLFIPVIDQPLSTNRYYVIKVAGKYKGYACTCSREMGRQNVEPSLFDPRNIYQQLEIVKIARGFTTKAVATDGIPPPFLTQHGIFGWRVYTSNSYNLPLSEALGLNPSLRKQLPELPMSNNSSIVVGKWHCPFVFIREGSLKDQIETSLFYEMTLERVWEEIYTCENDNTRGNVVKVNVSIKTEVDLLCGKEAVKDDTSKVDGVVWFRHLNHNEQAGSSSDEKKKKQAGLSLGLTLPIVKKMRSVHGGKWARGGKSEVKMQKVVELTGQWKRFGCFVLVERFSLKRMDGTLLLTCDKRIIDQIQCKWDNTIKILATDIHLVPS